jgi:ArsR family transcriptional regulator
MTMKSTIQFLKTIADQNRLLILFLLKKHTLCVCDLQQVIPLTQGALSIQLKSLSSGGLLDKQRQGKWVFYRLAENIDPAYLTILFQLFEKIENSASVTESISKLTITETCKIK